jgi:hypothetical protein
MHVKIVYFFVFPNKQHRRIFEFNLVTYDIESIKTFKIFLKNLLFKIDMVSWIFRCNQYTIFKINLICEDWISCYKINENDF